MIRPPPRSTLSPYTTLFRSYVVAVGPLRLKSPASHTAVHLDQILAPAEQAARPTDRPVRQGERRCRSEEHTSELQSQSNIVCRLLLEKKNTSKISYRQTPGS